MAIFDRSDPDDFAVVDRWSDGFGWQVHPGESGARTSHAVRGADGVWLVDPLDAPGIDERIADLGPVAGVTVLSSWHSRDAGVLARRHDVPVSIPDWMTRVPGRVDAPVERFDTSFGDPPVRVDRFDPLPTWREGLAYRQSTGTIYAPDLLRTIQLVGDERVGLTLPARIRPPRELLGDRDVERVLVGHGHGIFADAEAALADALDGARQRLPRALLEQGPALAATGIAALRG